MFEQFFESEIIGFDTETGIRYAPSDIQLLDFSQDLPEEYRLSDYCDTLDCYAAIVKTASYISQNLPVLMAFRQSVDNTSDLERYIKQYALHHLYSADKLTDYDLISKVSYPRFGCLVGTAFDNIKDFGRAENIFHSEVKDTFILKDHSRDFVDLIIRKIRAGQNFAIVTFNLEFDFNALMCNLDPTYLYRNDIIDERLPTKIHADKTITWKDKDKSNKGCCKWVDAMLLSEKGMSIKRYGNIASDLYQADYHKMDTYDYDNVIYTAEDLAPTQEELLYCYRDVRLALWGLAYLLRQHVPVLNKCNLLKKPSDLPITCSHLYDMVNVVNTLDVNLKVSPSRRKKYFSSYKKNVAKDNELHFNPRNEDMYYYLKKGFGGGKISFNPLYLEVPITGGYGYSLDLCSAYPFQVVNMYPDMDDLHIMDRDYFNKSMEKISRIAADINQGNFVNIIDRFRYGWTARINIYDLKLKKDMQLPLLGDNDGALKLHGASRQIRNRLIEADNVEITVTHADMIIIAACYDYSELWFSSGYVYRLRPMNTNLRRKFTSAGEFKSTIKKYKKMPFKNFPVEEFNAYIGQDLLSRSDTAAEHKAKMEAAYANSKVLYNGIYGKACQSLIHSKKYIDEEGNITITQDKYKPRQGTCYTTGRYIATYTRLHLCMAYFIALRQTGPEDIILYAHTDSLKIYLFSEDHESRIKKILDIYNEGIKSETDLYLSRLEHTSNDAARNDIMKAWTVITANGIGLLEDEIQNRFTKAIVCGNMRILTEDDDGNCHITFSGVNVPYVISGGRENYSPEEYEKILKETGIFALYEKYFCSGRTYTMYESCKTTLDYKHYNMLINPALGHICQTVKEMPIEINGDSEQVKRDEENIEYWRKIYYEGISRL